MFFRQGRERSWNLHVLHYGMNILLIWKIKKKLLLSKQRSTHSLIALKICYSWVIGCCIKERVASENVKFFALKFQFFISSDCWRTKFKIRNFFALCYGHPPYLTDEAYNKHLRYILHTQSRRVMPRYLDDALKNGHVRRMSDFSYWSVQK